MKNLIPKLTTVLILISSVANLPAQEPRQPGHDERLYGKRLSYCKVEGVGPCIAAEVVGNRLCAIGQGNLHVLDITTPAKPKLLGKLSGLGTTRQLVVKNNIAYVTARQDGLWLVDVSDPAKPALISHYDTVEMATGIWVSGGLAFIATRCYGVEIVDVSNPRNVRHVSTLKTVEAQSCWTKDGLLYIGDWVPKKLLVADVKNPRQPVILSEAPLDGYGDGGCLRGEFCFAATGHHSRAPSKEEAEGKGHGLDIYNVSKPTQPVFVSRVKFPVHYSIFNDMWSARVAGDHCVAADTNNGLFVVNVRDIAKPAIVAHAQLPYVAGRKMFDPVGGVALADGVIYAAGIYTGLYVVPAPGLAQPVVPETDQPPVLPPLPATAAEDPDFHVYRPEGQVQAVTIQGDIAWAACGAAGIQAIRLGDKLMQAAIHYGRSEVCYVSRTGNRLFTAEGKGGMAIYEIGADLRLTELGRLTMPGQGVKQVVAPAPGRFALFHCGGATVHIADVSNPANPKLVFSDSQVGLFYGDQLVDKLFDNRFLTAYWHRSGPAWYDISGAKPALAGNTPDTTLFSWTDGVCPLGDKLLIIKRSKYALLDPNERRNASDLPAYGVNGLRFDGRPSVGGNLLAVASRHQRQVWVLDIADIKHPRLKRHYSLFGHPGACGFWNNRVVIPAGYQGLLLER
ncbi:MAG: hypothetical protein NT105_06695 [Verrucomicrobia bacterium]|nr:hypothetical protein [Verrucomicrobiota bacterium]